MSLFCKSVFLLFLFSTIQTVAQEADSTFRPTWSIYVGAGENFPASESMQGSPADLAWSSSLMQLLMVYPYENPTSNLGIDLRVQKSLSARFSVYIGGSFDRWEATGYNSFFGFIRVDTRLDRVGAEFGAQFVALPIFTWLDFVVSGAIQANVITGDVIISHDLEDTVYSTTVTYDPAFRIGVRTDCGLTIHVPSTPLLLSVLAGYQNNNLIGKSYEMYTEELRLGEFSVPFNDDVFPGNGNDTPRVISSWTWRLLFGVEL